MDRVFLDANVLFSAAWREDSGLLRLWRLADVRLLSSAYALEEARRNLDSAERRERLELLAAKLESIVEAITALDSAAEGRLPADDRPILRAAMAGRATHLLSGDRHAFGRHYDRRLGGVLILGPAVYLRSREVGAR